MQSSLDYLSLAPRLGPVIFQSWYIYNSKLYLEYQIILFPHSHPGLGPLVSPLCTYGFAPQFSSVMRRGLKPG